MKEEYEQRNHHGHGERRTNPLFVRSEGPALIERRLENEDRVIERKMKNYESIDFTHSPDGWANFRIPVRTVLVQRRSHGIAGVYHP